ncbi:uncharacterized protein NECHADRAFT_85051 [Fusarium vanettenii 77-13-4]|uniref:Uncharacterized protein n=1 Tax=Fusarium vanettenii (strain ATCC MYA-4622 / CBS 123669 / FGSC 9596 / NRRL 45880 / 77-13-4) TaxID=660122 RepID=C7YUV2_FUSV7|nr:uncharacterized protein NECHADRAFT_85051 [Fusarium vanettenii 77-13-4]EEU44872.1 predicted protein [Fusarium vanettenii 77-13-4]
MNYPSLPRRYVVSHLDFSYPRLQLPRNRNPRVFWTCLPGVTRITQGRNNCHINFEVAQLPEGPWPLRIDGVPFTIHSPGDNESRGYGRFLLFPSRNVRFGSPLISICEELDGRQAALSDEEMRLITTELARELSNCAPEVDLIEVIFASDAMFYIVLNNEANLTPIRSQLPGVIANCGAGYCLERDFDRPDWRSWKERETPACIPIRRGPVFGMISGTRAPTSAPSAAACTTPGILVKNAKGQYFLTIAAHCIGRGDPDAYFSLSTGQMQPIGRAAAQVPFTDVALIDIKRTNFHQHLFLDTGHELPVRRLLGEDPNDQLNWNHMVRFRSPIANDLDGVIVAKSARPKINPFNIDEPFQCVVYHWAFTGQVEDAGDDDMAPRPPAGTSGAAVVDEEGICVGLFDHFISQGPWAGFSVILSTSELVKAGYQLVGGEAPEEDHVHEQRLQRCSGNRLASL